MTKKRRTSNRSKYINYQELEKYGLGSFIGQRGGNSGIQSTIGQAGLKKGL